MQKKTVAFIEDDENFYSTFSIPLTKNGYKVVHISDGLKAMEMLRAEQPALVLLDIMLPGMTGLDILSEIKADAELKKAKVVMLTNFGTDDKIGRAMELGADDYFMKYNVVPTEPGEKVAVLLGDQSGQGIDIAN